MKKRRSTLIPLVMIAILSLVFMFSCDPAAPEAEKDPGTSEQGNAPDTEQGTGPGTEEGTGPETGTDPDGGKPGEGGKPDAGGDSGEVVKPDLIETLKNKVLYGQDGYDFSFNEKGWPEDMEDYGIVEQIESTPVSIRWHVKSGDATWEIECRAFPDDQEYVKNECVEFTYFDTADPENTEESFLCGYENKGPEWIGNTEWRCSVPYINDLGEESDKIEFDVDGKIMLPIGPYGQIITGRNDEMKTVTYRVLVPVTPVHSDVLDLTFSQNGTEEGKMKVRMTKNGGTPEDRELTVITKKSAPDYVKGKTFYTLDPEYPEVVFDENGVTDVMKAHPALKGQNLVWFGEWNEDDIWVVRSYDEEFNTYDADCFVTVPEGQGVCHLHLYTRINVRGTDPIEFDLYSSEGPEELKNRSLQTPEGEGSTAIELIFDANGRLAKYNGAQCKTGIRTMLYNEGNFRWEMETVCGKDTMTLTFNGNNPAMPSVHIEKSDKSVIYEGTLVPVADNN